MVELVSSSLHTETCHSETMIELLAESQPLSTDPNVQHLQVEVDSQSLKDGIGDPNFDGKLIELGLTSNIGAMGLNDCGSFFFSATTIFEDVAHSGKYIGGVLRDYTIGLVDSSEKSLQSVLEFRVPLVDESDFAEYFRQVGDDDYDAGLGVSFCQENGVTRLGSVGRPRHDSAVLRAYFSESYSVCANGIFNDDLDKIPRHIESLESQLETINFELRDALGACFRNFKGYFSCIYNLCGPFSDAKVRAHELRHIFKTVCESSFSSITENLEDSERGSSDFLEVVSLKKDLQTMLGYLQLLRAVALTPECIQGIAEGNNLEVARMFATCAIDYFQTELAKFSMVRSVTSVVGETVANLERVGEAKFVNIALVALLEFKEQTSHSERVKSMTLAMDKLEPSLVLLSVGDCVVKALDALVQSSENVRRNKNSAESCGVVSEEAILGAKNDLLSFFESSQVWLAMLLRRIFCVKLLRDAGGYSPGPEESRRIVHEVLSLIQDGVATSGGSTRRSYHSIAESTSLLCNTLSLPKTCRGCLDYAVAAKPDFSVLETVSIDVEIVKRVKLVVSKVAHNYLRSFLDGFDVKKYIATFTILDRFELLLVNFSSFRRVCESLMTDIEDCERFGNYFLCLVILEEFDPQVHKLQSMESCDEAGELVSLDTIRSSSELSVELGEIVKNELNRISKHIVGLLYVESLARIQELFEDEDWSLPARPDGYEDKDFIMMKAVTELDGFIGMCTKVCEALPNVGTMSLYNSVSLLIHFYKFLDEKIPPFNSYGEFDDFVFGRLCMIANSVQLLSSKFSSAVESIKALTSEGSESGDGELLLVACNDAEAYRNDAESLVQKLLKSIACYVFVLMKLPVFNWLSPHQEGNPVSEVAESVRFAFNITSQFLSDPQDLLFIFKIAFQEIIAFVSLGELNAAKNREFDEECAELINLLSEVPMLHSQISSFVDFLSSELS